MENRSPRHTQTVYNSVTRTLVFTILFCCDYIMIYLSRQTFDHHIMIYHVEKIQIAEIKLLSYYINVYCYIIMTLEAYYFDVYVEKLFLKL